MARGAAKRRASVRSTEGCAAGWRVPRRTLGARSRCAGSRWTACASGRQFDLAFGPELVAKQSLHFQADAAALITRLHRDLADVAMQGEVRDRAQGANQLVAVPCGDDHIRAVERRLNDLWPVHRPAVGDARSLQQRDELRRGWALFERKPDAQPSPSTGELSGAPEPSRRPGSAGRSTAWPALEEARAGPGPTHA